MGKSILFILAFAAPLFAQANAPGIKRELNSDSLAYDIGRSYVSAGYGVGVFARSFLALNSFGGYDHRNTTSPGTFHLKYEYALTKMVGVSLSANYVSVTSKYSRTGYVYEYDSYGYLMMVPRQFNDKAEFTSVSVLTRINLHFGTGKRVDPYWGAGMGYRYTDTRYTSDDPNYYQYRYGNIWGNGFFPLGFETTFGMRVLFNKNFGAYTEVGFAKSILQFGLLGKF